MKAKRYIHDGQSVVYAGQVKRVRHVDPTVDTILELVGSEGEAKETSTEGLVTLRVHSDPNSPQGNRPIEMNLNGQNYTIARDTPTTVPVEIADLLVHSATRTTMAPIDGKTQTGQDGQYLTPLEERDVSQFKVTIDEVVDGRGGLAEEDGWCRA